MGTRNRAAKIWRDEKLQLRCSFVRNLRIAAAAGDQKFVHGSTAWLRVDGRFDIPLTEEVCRD